MRALEDLSADHQPGLHPGAEAYENADVRSGQRAPTRLGERRRVHIVRDGDRRYAEAVAQHGWKGQAIPAGEVRRQLHAGLLDDPGADGAGPEAVARCALAYALRCRERPLNGLLRAALRVRLNPIGHKQLAVET